jgi:hypothetical protein
MDSKLTMLFLLFGTIIGLSYLNYENTTKMKRGFDGQRWRDIVPRWHKSLAMRVARSLDGSDTHASSNVSF